MIKNARKNAWNLQKCFSICAFKVKCLKSDQIWTKSRNLKWICKTFFSSKTMPPKMVPDIGEAQSVGGASHLDVDSFLGLLAIKEAFDVKVWAPRVLLHRWTHPLPLTGYNHVGIHSCGKKKKKKTSHHRLHSTSRQRKSLKKYFSVDRKLYSLLIKLINKVKESL